MNDAMIIGIFLTPYGPIIKFDPSGDPPNSKMAISPKLSETYIDRVRLKYHLYKYFK